MSDTVYKYEPKVAGAFLNGVPARDLSAADVAALEPQAKSDLEGSEHYAKVGEQADPDARVPNRTDADTIAPGFPTPVTDEPLQDNAPSFTQVDIVAPTVTDPGVGTEESK